eukprot:3716400-Prymnesium_polylepis.1
MGAAALIGALSVLDPDRFVLRSFEGVDLVTRVSSCHRREHAAWCCGSRAPATARTHTCRARV